MKKTTAIKTFKTASNLARALGITRMAVSKWDENIPELRAFQIESLVRAAKEHDVILSEVRITKTGHITHKVPKGEEPLSVQREQTRLLQNAQ